MRHEGKKLAVLNYTCSENSASIPGCYKYMYLEKAPFVIPERVNLLAITFSVPLPHIPSHTLRTTALSGFGFGHISQSVEGVMGFVGLNRFSSGILSYNMA